MKDYVLVYLFVHCYSYPMSIRMEIYKDRELNFSKDAKSTSIYSNRNAFIFTLVSKMIDYHIL